MKGRPKLGHCWACGAETFEILNLWPQHHAFGGEPRRIGNPKPGVHRDTFVLSTGRLVALTFCGKCEALPATLPEIWKKVRWAQAREGQDDYRKTIGAKPLTPKQKLAMARNQLDFGASIPLGRIARVDWKEIR